MDLKKGMVVKYYMGHMSYIELITDTYEGSSLCKLKQSNGNYSYIYLDKNDICILYKDIDEVQFALMYS